MLYIKYLVFCVSLFFILNCAAAEESSNEPPQTFGIESTDDVQADGTTMFPPLIEIDPNPQTVDNGMPNMENMMPVIGMQEPKEMQSPNNENPPKTPEGPVNEYVSSSGGPYQPPNMYSGNYFQGYAWPYFAQPQYQQHYYSQLSGSELQSAPSTTYVPMQPEYAGVLVPVQSLSMQPPRAHQSQTPPQVVQQQQIQQTQMSTQQIASNRTESKIPSANRNSFDLALILQALLPPTVIQIIITLGNFLLNSFSTLAFAGAITSALCSLTPICTLSLGSAFPFNVRQVQADGTDLSAIQRVRRAAEFVSSALDKYEKLQKGVEKLTNSLKKAQQRAI